MLVFNMNSVIKVKLNDFGRQVLADYHSLSLSKGWIKSDYYKKLIIPKKDGFYHFQMHQFIKIFGEKISIGSLPAIESCLIYFDEKDLETVDDASHPNN